MKLIGGGREVKLVLTSFWVLGIVPLLLPPGHSPRCRACLACRHSPALSLAPFKHLSLARPEIRLADGPWKKSRNQIAHACFRLWAAWRRSRDRPAQSARALLRAARGCSLYALSRCDQKLLNYDSKSLTDFPHFTPQKKIQKKHKKFKMPGWVCVTSRQTTERRDQLAHWTAHHYGCRSLHKVQSASRPKAGYRFLLWNSHARIHSR